MYVAPAREAAVPAPWRATISEYRFSSVVDVSTVHYAEDLPKHGQITDEDLLPLTEFIQQNM
jgi:hypothetical protein